MKTAIQRAAAAGTHLDYIYRAAVRTYLYFTSGSYLVHSTQVVVLPQNGIRERLVCLQNLRIIARNVQAKKRSQV